MIITEQKKFEDIAKSLEGFDKIILVGCGECATTCQTGGEKEVLEIKEKLEKIGKNILGYVIVDAVCDERLVRKEFSRVKEQISDADCFLCLGCGSGSGTLNDLYDIAVIPAVDTKFLGVIKRIGAYDERCSLCGECVLDKTLGICPVTRCSKGLMNGPCGGAKNGKCEVDDKLDCIWGLIFKRLKRYNKMDRLERFYPAKDYSSRPARAEKKSVV